MKPVIAPRLYNREELIGLLKLEGCIWNKVAPMLKNRLAQKSIATPDPDAFVEEMLHENFDQLFGIHYLDRELYKKDKSSLRCVVIWGSDPDAGKGVAWEAILAFEIDGSGIYSIVPDVQVVSVNASIAGEEELCIAPSKDAIHYINTAMRV